MTHESVKRGRLAFLAVATVMVAALVALPAVAQAKTTTRIVAATSTTVVRDTAGVNPWLTKTLTATLQKKSRTRYVALKSGTVRLYRYDLDLLRYVYITSKKSSSTGKVTFPITGRGKYKLYYRTTPTYKAATKYSTFYENIGIVVDEPSGLGDITFERIGLTTKYWVNITYHVHWNAEAWTGLVTVNMESAFLDALGNNETAWVNFFRDVEGGVVEFNYKVDESAFVLPRLNTSAIASAALYGDPYIVDGPEMVYDKDTNLGN